MARLAKGSPSCQVSKGDQVVKGGNWFYKDQLQVGTVQSKASNVIEPGGQGESLPTRTRCSEP